jgi:hypothetical protein
MTFKQTIELARETKMPYDFVTGKPIYLEKLKAFEALVRADQDEKYKWDIHSCGPSCTKAACVAMREAVLAEREACAQVVEEYPHWLGMTAKAEIANAIRNRGNT